MEKEVHINSHIFSRNLAAKLSSDKYIIFNLLSEKGKPVFEITKTNSDVMKKFCQEHGKRFDLSKQRVIHVDGKFSLMFD